MFKVTRRITSFNDANQKPQLLADEIIEAFSPFPTLESFQLQNLFYIQDFPPSLSTRHSDTPYNLDLPAGALRFVKIRMPTQAEIVADLRKNNQEIPTDWRKFNVHRTDSIDYLYVLSGKITYVVGEELIELNEGDFLTQLGPEHTWINDNDQPCYLFGVVVGVKPTGLKKEMAVDAEL